MTLAAPTLNVHIEIPDFQALSERGHWDACAVVAEADALHVCAWNGVPLVENTINAWRWQYIQAKRWTQGSGTTLGNIYWHLTQTAIRAHVAAYIPYADSPNLDALHQLLKAQCLAQNPIIIEVGNAAALPHAEQGVQYHFVTIGGIDSAEGYLIANGDTLDAFSHANGAILPTYWASWQTLVNAKICGAIALDRGYKPPAPPPAPAGSPLDTASLLALLAEAETTLDAIKAKLGG